MKKLLLAFAMIALSACSTVANIAPVASTVLADKPVLANTTIDEKAAYAAEAAYNVPAAAYVSADSRGLLSASVKAIVRPKLIQMRKLLLLARQAYKVGDATGFGNRVGELNLLSVQVNAMIPG